MLVKRGKDEYLQSNDNTQLLRNAFHHYPHFTDGETEAQRVEETYLRSPTRLLVELGLEPSCLESYSSAIATRPH